MTLTRTGAAVEKTWIQPSRGWQFFDLKELWAFRELFFFLTWRDVKVRYKQTLLGAAWAVLQPLILAVIFAIVFGRVAKIETFGRPYLVFAFTALVPWTLFSQGVSSAANALVANANMVSKVYFPRVVAPIAAAGAHLVDFFVSFVILVGMIIYFGITPTTKIFWLPALIALTFLAPLGLGIWLAALNVRYRDVRYVVPFLLQALLFASPLGYSTAELSDTIKIVYGLNPVSGIAEGFRWAFLDTPLPKEVLLLSVLSTVVLLVTGLAYFKRVERTFADVI